MNELFSKNACRLRRQAFLVIKQFKQRYHTDNNG